MFGPKHTTECFHSPRIPLLQPPQNLSPPAIRKKTTKQRYLLPVIAVILIAIIAVAVFVMFNGTDNPVNGSDITFTAFNEHLVIYPHNTDNTNTVNYDIPLDGFNGPYSVGQQIVIQIPYSYQGDTGTENITRMECNTSGFSLASVSPELPCYCQTHATMKLPSP